MSDQSQEFIQRDENSTLSGPVLTELLRAVLDRGEPFWFEAPGFSMSPFIQDGDTITVAPLTGPAPGHGDVVAFLRPGSGKVVVHRVVGKRGDALRIRGDNGGEECDLASASSILGRVTKVERNGQSVRLGLGPERRIIAVLSRWGLLQPLLRLLWPPLRPIVRRVRP